MKKLDPATAAYWQLMGRALNLYVTLPSRKCVDALRARLDEFKAQWPEYPTDRITNLEELLKGV